MTPAQKPFNPKESWPQVEQPMLGLCWTDFYTCMLTLFSISWFPLTSESSEASRPLGFEVWGCVDFPTQRITTLVVMVMVVMYLCACVPMAFLYLFIVVCAAWVCFKFSTMKRFCKAPRQAGLEKHSQLLSPTCENGKIRVQLAYFQNLEQASFLLLHRPVRLTLCLFSSTEHLGV